MDTSMERSPRSPRPGDVSLQLSSKEEPSKTIKILAAAWLVVLTALSISKISIGSLYISSGCRGCPLLPYYLLLAGLLALIPACIAVLVTFFHQYGVLQEFWDMMAKIFLFTVVVMISGTIYILVVSSRAVSLDRLCTDMWVPVYSLTVLVVDWIMFALFFRLFCVNSVPEAQLIPTEEDFLQEESPFYMWKHRHSRAF